MLNRTCSEHKRLNWARLSKGLCRDASVFAKQVPAYQLKVSFEGGFWTDMERVVR